jgi:hypothetical protein
LGFWLGCAAPSLAPGLSGWRFLTGMRSHHQGVVRAARARSGDFALRANNTVLRVGNSGWGC